MPWAASGRAIANGRDEGQTKLLFDEQTGRIVGGGIVGTNAGDLISEVALAIEMGADAVDIGRTIRTSRWANRSAWPPIGAPGLHRRRRRASAGAGGLSLRAGAAVRPLATEGRTRSESTTHLARPLEARQALGAHGLDAIGQRGPVAGARRVRIVQHEALPATSSYIGSRLATTATSRTPGTVMITASISEAATFSPPTLSMSFERSEKRAIRPGRRLTRSPVMNRPWR